MNLANLIDHTYLRPDCHSRIIKKLCKEALEHSFAAVCIPPLFVREAKNLLNGSNVKVATVIGFPMGYSSTAAKVEEIKRAIEEGAAELDVVVNIAAVKNQNWSHVANDISSMVTAVHMKGKVIKVILETGLMTEGEIKRLCEIALQSQADFVKTSTGFNGEGATVKVIQLLKSCAQGKMKIKASGGIRTHEDAVRLVQAGAHRLGASSSLLIMG